MRYINTSLFWGKIHLVILSPFIIEFILLNLYCFLELDKIKSLNKIRLEIIINYEKHKSLQLENKVNINLYTLIPGLNIAFNQVYTDQCVKGDLSTYSNQMVINFCVCGRCEATLSNNKSAIV